MKIVVLGPQGSGKGTEAELLSRHFKLPHIDAGQLLREEMAKGTGLGTRIQGFMERGELLPHKLIDRFMKKRLSMPDCRNGFVLDGYPRHIEEVKFLNSIHKIDAVVFLQVPDSVVFRRIARRRVCEKCLLPVYGRPTELKAACAKCGGRLVRREDDKPKALRKRLAIYHRVTEPLIAYYGPLVRVIDATGGIQSVFRRILQSLKCRKYAANL